MKYSKRLLTLAVAAACSTPMIASATNGMLMEGYGPIALGMGGASMAYDNGTAAMANNPATLGLMADGSRLDLAVGFIGPNVKSNAFTGSTMQTSNSDGFYMPAIGYATKSDKLTYGVGMYAQGGMGTGYGSAMAEVMIARLIFPLAYNVNDQLTVGGSIDYVMAGMDLVYPGAVTAKDDTSWTGKMHGEGVAFKLGMTYEINKSLTVGAKYETAGNLSDLKGGGTTMKKFDMPPQYGVGLSYKPSDKMMVVADAKVIQWTEVMKTPTVYPGPVPFTQNWNDQTVLQLGMSYDFNAKLTGRIGANIAKNPIPNTYVNPLWPATVENHYTLGVGYNLSDKSSIDFAMSMVPEVKVTGTGATPPTGNGGQTTTHSQFNWQLMYSTRF